MHTRHIIAQHIQHALKLANLSIILGAAAIICFLLFGTLASLASLKDSTWVYFAFHYLTYALIGLSIPISLYHAFLLWRYRIMDRQILLVVIFIGVGLLIYSAIELFIRTSDAGFMGLFLTMMAWFAMPFLFRVNFRKFLKFLEETNNTTQENV